MLLLPQGALYDKIVVFYITDQIMSKSSHILNILYILVVKSINHDHCIEYDSVCITGITFLMLCHTYHAIPTKYYYALYTSMQYHSLPSNIIHYIYIVKNTILTIFKDFKRNYQLIDFKEKASWLWVDRLL